MHRYLAQHPEIFMYPGPWEPQYFATDIKFSWFPQMTEKDYLKLFSEARDERLLGEKSTAYLASEVAAAKIHEFSPDAFIIAMLRNPVDMIYSLHSQLILMGFETISDFHEALTTETERLVPQHNGHPGALNVTSGVYWNSVRFAEQLQRYFDVFGKDKVHVVIFDDLRRDTAAVYRDTLRFLQVEDVDFRPDLSVVNANKRHRSEFIRRPPSFARAIARGLMPKSMRQKLRRKLADINISHKPRPPMDPNLQSELRQTFAPQVEQLSRLLGRDLSHWCKPA